MDIQSTTSTPNVILFFILLVFVFSVLASFKNKSSEKSSEDLKNSNMNSVSNEPKEIPSKEIPSKVIPPKGNITRYQASELEREVKKQLNVYYQKKSFLIQYCADCSYDIIQISELYGFSFNENLLYPTKTDLLDDYYNQLKLFLTTINTEIKRCVEFHALIKGQYLSEKMKIANPNNKKSYYREVIYRIPPGYAVNKQGLLVKTNTYDDLE